MCAGKNSVVPCGPTSRRSASRASRFFLALSRRACASCQRPTLVHLSAQRKPILWDTPGGFCVSVSENVSG